MKKNVVSFMILSLLLLTGCASKRHIKAGDNFMQEGRYELAVRAYSEALQSRRKDTETQQKLIIAEEKFNQWLAQISLQAQQAEANQHNEVALLLYAKLAQQGDFAARQAFNRLYTNIRPQVVYQVYLERQQSLDLTASIQTHPDLMLANSPVSGSGINLSALLSPESFTIHEQQIVRSGEFLAHYKKEENPQFRELNHDIDHLEEDIRRLEKDWRKADKKVRQQQTDVTLLEKDQEIWTLKIADLPVNSTAAQRLQAKLKTLEEETLPKALRELKKRKRHLTAIDDDLKKSKRRKTKLLERFRHTEPTVDVPVYATIEYPVQIMTKRVNGQLTLTTNQGRSSQLVIRAEHTDEGHNAIPQLQLDANPIQLQSDAQMRLAYQANATTDAMATVLTWKDNYRRQLAENALNAQTPNQRTQLFVRYLLSGEVSDSNLVNQFKAHLAFTYGKAGEFDLPTILFH